VEFLYKIFLFTLYLSVTSRGQNPTEDDMICSRSVLLLISRASVWF